MRVLLRSAILFSTLAMIGCASTDLWLSTDAGGSSGEGGSKAPGGCEPGEGKCEGNQVLVCNPDRKSYRKGELCSWPGTCNYGKCQPTPACLTAKAVRSYVGCEYFAVDMDNIPAVAPHYSPRDGEYAIVVSNATISETPVMVKIFSKESGSEQVIAEGTVPSNETKVFKVTPPRNVLGTSKSMLALRVVSDGPVTAYQFNPLNNTDKAYSNDASLLLPAPSLDKDYIVTTADGIEMTDTYDTTKRYNAGSLVTVVGTEDNTRVRVIPTADLVAGAGITAGGRQPIEVTLNRYEVLNLESIAPKVSLSSLPKKGQANLSGTAVHADKPVAVFGGNICSPMPLEFTGEGLNKKLKCCCDHLEEQFFPLSAWGKSFAVAHTESRIKAGGERNYYRVTGGAAAIKLAYAPATPAGAPAAIGKGESVEFSTAEDFILEATGPVQLAQFLSSSDDVAPASDKACASHADCESLPFLSTCHLTKKKCSVAGDPSMIMIPPVEQFRDKYVFLTPVDYKLNFVNVVAPVGAQIQIDGKPLDKLTSVGKVGGVEYGVARVKVGDGKHVIKSDKRAGAIAYGFDAYVSYGYPAGLDLQRINPIE